MKQVLNLVITLYAILFLLGCENLSGPSPQDVLSKYLDASLKERYEEAYGYVSSRDKSEKSLKEYLTENNKNDNPFTKAIASNISFKINAVTVNGDNATGEVAITLPDMGAMFTDIMGAAFKSAIGGGNEKEIESALAKKYEDGNVPLTTKQESFHLIKEQGEWKVFLDWKTKKLEKEKRGKVQALMTEAEQLKDSKKLHGALKKYEEVLELDSEMIEAKKGVEETKSEIAKND